MIVYADILFVLNFIVDYFLLKITVKILKISPKLYRFLLSALLGACFSLYIFFPKSNLLVESAVRLLMNALMVLVLCGFRSAKQFLKSMGTLYIVTCLYAGVMIAVWQLFKPRGMVIHNSVVYFNLSPVVMIGSTVAGYFIYIFAARLFAVSAKTAERCEIVVFADGNSVGATAIVDTGNSVSDIFGESEIIIADKSVCIALFGNLDIFKNEILKNRYRAVPCETVSGKQMLDGYRCDRVKIITDTAAFTVEKPILAVSKTALKDNYTAILNPKIFEKSGEKNENQKLTV